jgi:hypothetical protein
MLLWALASPIASVPDEPTHFIRAAAVVRGELTPKPWTKLPWQGSATVPNYVAHTEVQNCFGFKPDVPAACQTPVKGDPNKLVTIGETADANSPLFYALVGLPTLFLSGSKALYAMRGVDALLCSLMVGFTFMCISQLKRPRWAYLAAFVTVTPMVLFLGGSVNPNGLEVTAAGALVASLAATFSTYARERILAERAGIIVIATVLLTGTRNISLLWVFLALVAALLLGNSEVLKRVARKPLVWIAAAAAAAVCVVELLWFIRPPVTAPFPPFAGVGTAPIIGFVNMLVNTLDYGTGWIGLFGWVDTVAPALTLIAWTVGLVGVVLPAIVIARGRLRWAVLVLAIALVLTPAVAQAAVIFQAGYIWQGRYTLAILVMLTLASGIALDSLTLPSPDRVLRTIVTVVVTLMGIGQIAAFVMTLRRYVIGATASLQLMITHPVWQPPTGWIALSIALTVPVTVACVFVLRLAFNADRRTSHGGAGLVSVSSMKPSKDETFVAPTDMVTNLT